MCLDALVEPLDIDMGSEGPREQADPGLSPLINLRLEGLAEPSSVPSQLEVPLCGLWKRVVSNPLDGRVCRAQ